MANRTKKKNPNPNKPILSNQITDTQNDLPTQQKPQKSFFTRIGSVVKVIKIELFFTLLTATLSLGQYFQSGISVRINVTSTWKDGYSAENRNRVAKFRYLYNEKWVVDCGENIECQIGIVHSIDKLAFASKLYSDDLKNDTYLNQLLSDEIELIQKEKKEADGKDLTREEYIQAALKYRNALIECLNTAEAVKAIVEARPLLRWHIFYSDTLEGRYRDIIKELTSGLMVFIKRYRKATDGRGTEAWYVLTSEESNKNDYFTVLVYIVLALIFLTIVYILKRKYSKVLEEEVQK